MNRLVLRRIYWVKKKKKTFKDKIINTWWGRKKKFKKKKIEDRGYISDERDPLNN